MATVLEVLFVVIMFWAGARLRANGDDFGWFCFGAVAVYLVWKLWLFLIYLEVIRAAYDAVGL